MPDVKLEVLDLAVGLLGTKGIIPIKVSVEKDVIISIPEQPNIHNLQRELLTFIRRDYLIKFNLILKETK